MSTIIMCKSFDNHTNKETEAAGYPEWPADDCDDYVLLQITIYIQYMTFDHYPYTACNLS